MTNYSKHLTPEDWGDPHEDEPTRLGMFLVLLLPIFFFLAGMSFEWWVRWGL